MPRPKRRPGEGWFSVFYALGWGGGEFSRGWLLELGANP